jgi:hypothetical protein
MVSLEEIKGLKVQVRLCSVVIQPPLLARYVYNQSTSASILSERLLLAVAPLQALPVLVKHTDLKNSRFSSLGPHPYSS